MRPIPLLLAVLAAACGGSEEPFVCGDPGAVIFSGELDGEAVEGHVNMRNLEIEDGGGSTSNLVLVVSEDGLDRIELEYRSEYDEQVEGHVARGFIDLSGQAGVVAGNCNIESFVSTLRFDDEERTRGTFTLRGLRAQPFCDGPLFAGVIEGCFRAP